MPLFLRLIVATTLLVSSSGCSGQNAATNNRSVNHQQTRSDKVDVRLLSHNDQKISVIRAVREITGLGLADAKRLVDSAPIFVKQGVAKEEAEQIRQKLETAGATVEVKGTLTPGPL